MRRIQSPLREEAPKLRDPTECTGVVWRRAVRPRYRPVDRCRRPVPCKGCATTMLTNGAILGIRASDRQAGLTLGTDGNKSGQVNEPDPHSQRTTNSNKSKLCSVVR